MSPHDNPACGAALVLATRPHAGRNALMANKDIRP